MGAQGDEGRLAACSDVQQGVASDEANFMTGSEIVVDGASNDQNLWMALGEVT